MKGAAHGSFRRALLNSYFLLTKAIATWKNLPKHCIFADFLLILNYIQGALQKELLIVSFVELFKNANFGTSSWQILPEAETIYLNIAFFANFCW